MKRKFLFALLAALALLAIYLVQGKQRKTTSPEIAQAVGITQGPPISSESSPPRTVPRDTATNSANKREEYICHIAKEKCLYDPLSAATEAEAAWLIDNGYPSNAEERELSSLSVDQLTAMAALGDIKAQVFLGKALIFNGKETEGLRRIADASAKGNLYASYALAEAHSAVGPIHDPVLSTAYYRLAYLQGDWKAAARASENSAQQNPAEIAMADRQAMALYRNLLTEKGKSGYKVFLAPRPD